MPITKKVFKNTAKPNGRRRRDILRAYNREWMRKKKIKTKQFKVAIMPPGFPSGKHLKNSEDCDCGRCSNVRRGIVVGMK